MRKKKHPEHVNHERWLISYADFITLLFAFFVVMFAVSQVDSNKVGRFTEAFSKAVGIDVFPMNGESILSGGKTPDETNGPSEQGQASVLDDLRTALSSMATNNDALQGLQVIKMRNELVLRLPEGVFFDSGDSRVKDATSRMLRVLLPELERRPVEVRIEGHTDNRPIVSGRFRSNWELSTARAIAVMEIFLAEKMPPERTSIAGYAEFRPIADNATEEGRKQNRRVDLVVTAIVEKAPAVVEKAPAVGEKAPAVVENIPAVEKGPAIENAPAVAQRAPGAEPPGAETPRPPTETDRQDTRAP